MPRKSIINTFLTNNVASKFDVEPINSDASFRKYERITAKKQKFIFMDANPKHCDPIDSFIKTNKILHDMGVKVPEIIASDVDAGLMLLEDLGDELLAKILENQFYNEVEFYRNTVNVLIHINKSDTQNLDSDGYLEEYNEEILLKEASLFPDYYLDIFETEIKDQDAFKSDFLEQIKDIIAKLKYKNDKFVHRDFHAENIIYLNDEKEKIKQIGLIDFQDALIGNPTYDLMSLLQDARRDVSKFLAEDMIKYFTFQIGEQENLEDFMNDYNIQGAIRNLKILGIFCRLKTRDKKAQYIQYIPRVTKHLLQNLQHPTLSNLKDFLEKECKTIK